MNDNGDNNEGSSRDDVDPPSSNNTNESNAWNTGLRRRRRNRQNSITSNSSSNSNIRSPSRNNNSYRGSMNGSAPPFSGTNTNNAHIGSSGGLCSSGGGGLGVATQGTSHHFENGSHHYKTPIKDGSNNNNNDKEGAVGGLVAATPSSITTAGDTAESTLVSQSPNAALTLRRRRSSSRRLSTINTSTQPNNNSLQRQYQLLRSQIMLLLGTSSIGLILFLFYALPLAAFISLALMISSIGALLPVIQSIVRARYEMEMQQPGGLTRYLPEYLRVLLTETSLHDFMTDDTFVMEHRYLLLYFMPGLQPEQLMGYINQLPERHRDALLQPGLGRLMPSVMENFMRIDNINHGNNGQQQLMLGNGGDDAASFASGLTVGDHQHQEEVENAHHNNGEGDNQVTLLEAVTGLRRTLQHAGVAINNMGGAAPDDEQVIVEMPAENNNVHHQTPLRAANNAPVNNNNDTNIQDADDNSSFDFSIDLDAHGLTDLVNQNGGEEATPPEPQNINTPTNVIVEMPQPAVDNDDQNQDEIQQQEIDLEGRILYEAANAAARNYASQAADIVGETASDVVVSTSSWFIRAGALTGFVAGMGGVITAALANQQGVGLNIFSITLGTLGGGSAVTNTGSSSLSGSAGGSSSGSSNDTTERRSNGYQSAVNGLLATSAVGFLSAGVAYLVRNRVRSNIAAKREEKRQQEEAKEGDNDKA